MTKGPKARTIWADSVNVYGFKSVAFALSLLSRSVKSDLFRSFGRPLIMPSMVNLLVTYKCHSKCLNCRMWEYYRKNPGQAEKEMTFEDFKTFVDNNRFLQDITLGGGEVFLRDDIVRMWLYLDQFGYRTGATTNALSLEDIIGKETELLGNLSGRNVHTLQISIDGFQEAHDRIRGIPGNFDKAGRLLNWAMDAEKKYPFFQVSVSHTICRENYREFPRFIDFLVEKGLSPRRISFRVAQRAPVVYDNEASLIDIEDKDELVALIERTIGKYREYGGDIFVKGIVRNIRDPKRLLVPCYAAFTFCHIDPFWNVYPCVPLDRILGNLRDHHFKIRDLWKTQAMDGIRIEIKRGNCPNCWTRCSTARSMVSSTAGILRLAFHEKGRLFKSGRNGLD